MSDSSNHQYVVLAGDAVDGFRVAGPFENADEAARWAASSKVPTEIHGREALLEDPDTISWPD